MDKTYIEEYHLVDLYVRGQLSGEDLDEFEIYMLEHPEIVDEIEYARGMQDALDESNESLTTPHNSAPGSVDTSGPWFKNYYAAAATVILAVAATLSTSLYFDNLDLKNEIDRISAPSVLSPPVRFESTRSGTTRRSIVANSEPLHFQIEVPKSAGVSVLVRLESSDTGVVWEQPDIEVDQASFITLLVPRLLPDDYEFTVLSSDTGNVSAKFSFTLERVEE